MSQGRDDTGRFTETVSDQDVLKVFDYYDDPVLTVQEVADGLRQFGKQMTNEGVQNRLGRMHDEGLVERKQFGARAVGWWATVAPELDPDTAETVESRRESGDWTEL